MFLINHVCPSAMNTGRMILPVTTSRGTDSVMFGITWNLYW